MNNPYKLPRLLPFIIAYSLPPLVLLGAYYGGLITLLFPKFVVWLFVTNDSRMFKDDRNPETNPDDVVLRPCKVLTWVWVPVQFVMLYGLIYLSVRNYFAARELVLLAIGLNMVAGTVGTIHAHEMMHAHDRFEQWLGDGKYEHKMPHHS